MDVDASRGLLRYFETLDDPRHHNVRHELSDLLAISILAVICGAEGWVEVEEFAHCKGQWLRTFLRLPNGIPSHDTFGRLFARLDPDQLEACFLNWTAALARRSEGRLVAVDGKTVRRSFDRAEAKAAIHMVSAWCEANQLVLGQLATDAKSNEITAVPRLLELLDLRGATVTVDAMNSQRAIAEQIVEAGGDYVMQVKANQGHLHTQLKVTLDEAIALDFADMAHDRTRTVDGGHGRVETRRLWCTEEIEWVPGRAWWKGLRSVAVVESKREVDGKSSTERRYYLSSWPGDDAAAMLAAVRGHWSVENRLHWSLDVSFCEDASRLRKGHGAENYSRLRRLALNLLNREKTVKAGKRAKSKVCGWNHDYLLKVLTQA